MHDGAPKANLEHYPTEGKEVDAWKTGIEMAKAKAREVGMSPKDEDDEDNDNDDNGHWFDMPFGNENDAVDLMVSEDKIQQMSSDVTVEDTVSNKSVSDTRDTCRALLPHEVLNILIKALNIFDVESTTPEPTSHTVGLLISPIIKPHYKSIMVKLLHENPKVSLDRLTKVCQF